MWRRRAEGCDPTDLLDAEPEAAAGAEELVHLLGGAIKPHGRMFRQMAVLPAQEAEERPVELPVDPHLIGAVDRPLPSHPWQSAHAKRPGARARR